MSTTFFPLLQTVGQHSSGGTKPTRKRIEVEEERQPYKPVKPVRNEELSKCDHGVFWPARFQANEIYCCICSTRHLAHLLGAPDPRGKFAISHKTPVADRVFANANYTRKTDCPACGSQAHYSDPAEPMRWTCADPECNHVWEGSSRAHNSTE